MSHRSAHPALHERFRQALPEFSPTPLWWWSGDKVELDRLCWQLDRLVEQGVYNAVVINLAPTGPMYGALSDDPHILTDEWWQLWRGLCEHALIRGARLWFYDQFGFSGANLQGRIAADNPEFAGASVERVVADTDTACTLTCPAEGEPIAACALRLDDDGTVAGPPTALEVVDREVRWSGSGRHRVMLAYALRQGYDYLSRSACATLIDLVHGEFARRLSSFLGEVIVGSFQDELPSLPTWSASYADEFAERNGYRIEPVIAALWEDWGLDSGRVRVAYQRTRAALAEEAIFKPLHEWHERHGLLCGFDQQNRSRAGEPLSTVRQYADYLRTHRWYSAPGSDHHGDARIHSSLAQHYGRPRVWIEAFHTSGWGGTLEETFDWLVPWLVAGASLYNPHAVYYSTHGGWWEWAPPSTCWRQPYWRHYRILADTVSRLCHVVSSGDHVADLAVLFPTTTVQAGGQAAQRAHDAYLELVGRMRWFDPEPGVLARAGCDYAVLDDDSLAGAARIDGALTVAGARYRTVVLPACTMLETPTAQALLEFCEQGGRAVAVGGAPACAADAQGDDVLQRLRDHLIVVGSAAALATELPPAKIRLSGPALHRMVGDTHVLLVPAAPAGTATIQPMVSGTPQRTLHERGYRFDPGRYRPQVVVGIEGTAGDIEQWDPVSGDSRPARARSTTHGVDVTVDFSDAPLAVLVWRTVGSPPSDPPAAVAPTRVTELTGPWTSELIPTTDNRHGDLAWPPRAGPIPVQQWRLGHATGDTEPTSWSETTVGQGIWAWQDGPAPDSPKPVRYSLSRGIADDPLHVRTLGPKARVPDEFWHVPDMKAGQAVTFRTSLPLHGDDVTLAVAANGVKEITWNGSPLPQDPGGFLRLDRVNTVPGNNRLEVRVTAEQDGALRGYWTCTTDAPAFRRPEWVTPGDGTAIGTAVVVRGTLTVPSTPNSATAHLGTEGPAALYVNGHQVGVQGAFEPYGDRLRVLPYDITRLLRVGDNTVEVRFTDIGGPLAVLVDAEIVCAEETTVFCTDATWLVERDGRPVPNRLRRAQAFDAQWALLRRRPHPLPRAQWIDPASAARSHTVLDLIPEARPGKPKTAEWFTCAVPPGAVTATLPTDAGAVTVWLDGTEVEFSEGRVSLARPDTEHRQLTVRIVPTDGRNEGGLWSGPIEFDCGPGTLSPGSWAATGLRSYSGGVCYRRTVMIDTVPRRAVLDLGRVLGTAEVRVNGQPSGCRIWSPYRVEITNELQAGANTIEVAVFNTLAPYLDVASPTQLIAPNQLHSGLLGPVRLETS